VQPGENLFRIALRYGTTMQAIMAANGMTDPNRVYVGQRLVIPSGATSGSIISQTTSPAWSGQCGGFAPTSPLDGFHNGATTFYWNPAPGSIGGYRVEIFNTGGQLVATFDADGSSTSVTGDMSANRVGSGLTFSWDVIALVNGQPVCTTQRITAPRENSAP
jgi:LysM repeat protein